MKTLIELIVKSLLINKLGAGIRFLFKRYIRKENVSFRNVLYGKIENDINKESYKNSMCGIFFLFIIISLIVIIKSVFYCH